MKSECKKCKAIVWECKCPPTYQEVMQARELVKQGYRQTSGKYRMVARLPFGLTGKEALAKVAPGMYQGMDEESCADQYRRVYAKGEECKELDFKLFKVFKKELEKNK